MKNKKMSSIEKFCHLLFCFFLLTQNFTATQFISYNQCYFICRKCTFSVVGLLNGGSDLALNMTHYDTYFFVVTVTSLHMTVTTLYYDTYFFVVTVTTYCHHYNRSL